MKKMINQEKLEGYLYQSELAIKTVQNQSSANFGKEFISGTLHIAVDEDGLNVIPVHYTYVVEAFGSGKPNATYGVLKQIIENEDKTWIKSGKENAYKLRIDTALAVNDFYTQDNQLVTTLVNEGGFVSIVSNLKEEKERSFFNVDMLITNFSRIEKEDEEPYGKISGYAFNFRNELVPVDFVIRNEKGSEYFESLEPSKAEPVFTRVWGKINCLTKTITVTEESAFGEAAVKTRERKTKEWTVEGSLKEVYAFGDEGVLTTEELKTAVQNRDLTLADVKKRSDEYRASKTTQSAPAQATTTVVKNDAFDF